MPENYWLATLLKFIFFFIRNNFLRIIYKNTDKFVQIKYVLYNIHFKKWYNQLELTTIHRYIKISSIFAICIYISVNNNIDVRKFLKIFLKLETTFYELNIYKSDYIKILFYAIAVYKNNTAGSKWLWYIDIFRATAVFFKTIDIVTPDIGIRKMRTPRGLAYHYFHIVIFILFNLNLLP